MDTKKRLVSNFIELANSCAALLVIRNRVHVNVHHRVTWQMPDTCRCSMPIGRMNKHPSTYRQYMKSRKEKASVILVFVDLSAAVLLSRKNTQFVELKAGNLMTICTIPDTAGVPCRLRQNAKRALRQKSQSFAVQNGVLLHKIGDKLCRVVAINRALSYIYVSELKVAAFSCLIDGLVVPIWPYQFSNAVRSDDRSEHDTVLIISSSSFIYSRQHGP